MFCWASFSLGCRRYGNTQIAVLYDTNGDGIINLADLPGGTVPPISPLGDPAKRLMPLGLAAELAKGIHAGVIFYSAGKGESDADIVYSWK